MRYVVAAISILLFLLVLIFSIQNLASVDVAFLRWSISMPKVFLILGTYRPRDADRLGSSRADQEGILSAGPRRP